MNKQNLKAVLIFSKPKPLHEILRMASAKAKGIENTKSFILVKAIRYVEECGVYVSLYESYPESPVLEIGPPKMNG